MTPIVLPSSIQRFLIALIFLFIPVAILAPHAVVWEVILGGIISLYYSHKYALPPFPRPLFYIILTIPLWALITTLWSHYPLLSLLTSLKTLLLVTFGISWCRFASGLPTPVQRSLVQALIVGLLLAMFFLVINSWLGNPWQIFWNKPTAKAFAQGSLMISLATWPTLLWVLQRPFSLFKRLGLLVCLFTCVLLVLLHMDCDTSYIGLFMGLCVFSSTLLLPRLTSWGICLFTPLLIVLFPLICLYAFKSEYMPFYNSYIHSSSYLHRLYIWHETANTIIEHPWKGYGMNGTRTHEKARNFHEWSYRDDQNILKTQKTTLLAVHPHNAILQLWLELGFMGLILGTLLGYQILRHIYCANLRPLEKAISAGLFTGTFLIVWVNLGFWQNWWISGLWIIVGLTISQFKDKKEDYESTHNP